MVSCSVRAIVKESLCHICSAKIDKALTPYDDPDKNGKNHSPV
jgi:hypothetical protein